MIAGVQMDLPSDLWIKGVRSEKSYTIFPIVKHRTM